VDAGLHDEAHKTLIGWCVRETTAVRGQYVLGDSSWIHGSCSSNEGEALALLEAMKELQQRNFNDVIFEIDARRRAYMIAHIIARAAILWSRRHIFDLIPSCINNLLFHKMINDMSFLLSKKK
jgi:hypothetical protein